MAPRQHPVYEAYVEAWEERRRTGNTSDAVLLGALARHPVPEGCEPVSPQASELLIEMWRDGTSPRMLGPRVLGKVLRANWQAIRELVAVFTGPGSIPAWMNIPDGGEGVGFHAGKARVRRLAFEPAASVEHVWRRVSKRYRDYEGRATARVWLDTLVDEPRARVMVGKHHVGEVRLDAGDWARLRHAADDGLFSDGTLKVRETARGQYEFGWLRVYVPLESSSGTHSAPDD